MLKKEINDFLDKLPKTSYIGQILSSHERCFIITRDEYIPKLKEEGLNPGIYLYIFTDTSLELPNKINFKKCFVYVEKKSDLNVVTNILNKMGIGGVDLKKKTGLFPVLSFSPAADFINANMSDLEKLTSIFENPYNYLKILKAYETGNTSILKSIISKIDDMYFETEAEPRIGYTVISGGVSNIEEVNKFARRITKRGFFHGFEPSSFLNSNLKTINLENVKIEKYALSDKTKASNKFNDNSLESSLSDSGKSVIKSKTIDSILTGEKIDLIKLSINGSELLALKGAKETIKRFKPKLAINIKPVDLIEIPKYIYSLNKEYKFDIKYYDRYNSFENIVLYCY